MTRDHDDARTIETIGFVGLGNLGLPMAETAARSGFAVRGWDVSEDRRAAARDLGVDAAGDLAATADCDLLAVAVVDDTQVVDVVEQLASTLAPGTVVAVHSTVLPDTVQELGNVLGARDVGVLDAPVSGGDIAAREGSLTVILGADERWADVGRPYLEAVSTSIVHLGGLGSGSAGKLANQLMTFVNQLGAMEAMRFARAHGVDEERVVEFSRTSTSDSWILRNWGFFDRIHQTYEDGGTPPTGRPWSKDLWHVLEVARESGLDMPLAALASQLALPMFATRADDR